MEAPSKLDSQNQAAHEIANTVGNYLAGGKKEDRGEYLFFLAASWLFLLGIVAAVAYLMFAPWWAWVFQVLTDKEKIAGLVQSMGSWGPVVFILVQAVHVLLLFVPAPVEAVGGFLFGLPLGILYSTLGLGLGSMAAFSLGRWLERHWLSEVVPPQLLKRFRMLMKRQGTLTMFIIFLIPRVAQGSLLLPVGPDPHVVALLSYGGNPSPLAQHHHVGSARLPGPTRQLLPHRGPVGFFPGNSRIVV